MIITTPFNLSASTTSPRIVAPLTGNVIKGQWVYDQHYPQSGMPSGKGFMNWNYVLPYGYSSNFIYPILVWGHENDEGNGGGNYPTPGINLIFGDNSPPQNVSPDNCFNSIDFRTYFPCIVVVPECDQTTDSSGSTRGDNFGGYADSPNGTANELAVLGIIQTVLNTFSADPTRVYVTGDSLGAIGALAWLNDNNRSNQRGLNLITAGMGFSDQTTRPEIAAMKNVPYLAVSFPFDNNGSPYDQQAWLAYTGNNNYPTINNYGNTGTKSDVNGLNAPGSNFYYMNYNTSPWSTFRLTNGNGGRGSGMLSWLFSQII